MKFETLWPCEPFKAESPGTGMIKHEISLTSFSKNVPHNVLHRGSCNWDWRLVLRKSLSKKMVAQISKLGERAIPIFILISRVKSGLGMNSLIAHLWKTVPGQVEVREQWPRLSL